MTAIQHGDKNMNTETTTNRPTFRPLETRDCRCRECGQWLRSAVLDLCEDCFGERDDEETEAA